MKKLNPLELKTLTPAGNPTAGFVYLYFKSDGKLYKKDSSGVETEIGAGGGGGSSWWSSSTDISSNTTLSNEEIIHADASGGAITLTMPSASSNAGKKFLIIKTDSSTNNVAISFALNEFEDITGLVSRGLASQFETKAFYSTGTKWVEFIQGNKYYAPATQENGNTEFEVMAAYTPKEPTMAQNVFIGAEGNLVLRSLTEQPQAPSLDRIQLYARKRAGADFFEMQRSNGREIPIQPHMGYNRICSWSPSTSTTVVVSGMPRTAVGTVTTPAITIASDGLANSIRRWVVTSAATANAVADERSAQFLGCIGDGSLISAGFTYTNRISLVTLPTNWRAFFGLSTSTSAFATTQSPYALTNVIGMACESATDTTWQIVCNDGTGTVTKYDTGFDATDTSLVFTITIYCMNGGLPTVRVLEENTGIVFEQELDTNIPAWNARLSVRNYMNNGGTASACAYACSGVYFETDI